MEEAEEINDLSYVIREGDFLYHPKFAPVFEPINRLGAISFIICGTSLGKARIYWGQELRIKSNRKKLFPTDKPYPFGY